MITSLDAYINAAKARVMLGKTASRTTVAAIPFSVFELAGSPGAGTLAGANTANGVVPTDATAGFPTIPYSSGDVQLGSIQFASSVASRLELYDCLFKAGAYAFNANTTLASQPSFASRCPDYPGSGAVFGKGNEIWIEAVTAFTGNPSFQINYLDQDGNAGDSGVVASGAALTVGRMFRIPLAAGDSGVSQITQVRCTVATVGTFNVLVLRPLWNAGRVPVASFGDVHDMLKVGLPEIFVDSALFMQVTADSTASGIPDLRIEVINS